MSYEELLEKVKSFSLPGGVRCVEADTRKPETENSKEICALNVKYNWLLLLLCFFSNSALVISGAWDFFAVGAVLLSSNVTSTH